MKIRRGTLVLTLVFSKQTSGRYFIIRSQLYSLHSCSMLPSGEIDENLTLTPLSRAGLDLSNIGKFIFNGLSCTTQALLMRIWRALFSFFRSISNVGTKRTNKNDPITTKISRYIVAGDMSVD